MTHTCTPVSLFHNCSFSEARKDSCLASEASDSEDMCYQASVLDIEKHPLSVVVFKHQLAPKTGKEVSQFRAPLFTSRWQDSHKCGFELLELHYLIIPTMMHSRLKVRLPQEP